MSLQDPTDRIDLQSFPHAPVCKRKLLEWLWRDPYALEKYIEQTLFWEPGVTKLTNAANYRQQFGDFCAQLVWLVMPSWGLGLLFLLFTTNVIPLAEVHLILWSSIALVGTIGLGFGLFGYGLGWSRYFRSQSELGAITQRQFSGTDFSVLLAVATLFTFWAWVLLPWLTLAEVWLAQKLALNLGSMPFYFWLGFIVVSGLYLGAIWNGFVYALQRMQAPRWLQWLITGLVWLCLLTIPLAWRWQGRFLSAFTVGVWFGWMILILLCVVLGRLRIDDLLYDLDQLHHSATQPDKWVITRLTPLATPATMQQITYWLKAGPDDGLTNADQIWRYSNLRGALALQIYNLAWEQDENQLLDLLIALGDSKFAWHLLHFFPRPAAVTRGSLAQWLTDLSQFGPNFLWSKKRPLRSTSFNPVAAGWPSAPPPVAAPNFARQLYFLALGLEHLEQKRPTQALAAFAEVGEFARLAELQQLTKALAFLAETHNLLQLGPELELPVQPTPAWRQASWAALDKLAHAYHYIWLAQHCDSPLAKSIAKDNALTYLVEIEGLDEEKLPQPERFLIRHIEEAWRNELKQMRLVEAQPRTKLHPVVNPYLTSGPLPTHYRLNGHEATLAQLRTALRSDNLQPILLYGQPLVGKTSLIRRIQAEFPTVYLHLAELEPLGNRLAPWLFYISQRFAEVELAELRLPTLDSLQSEPYAAFDPYVRQLIHTFTRQGEKLLIVFDGVERLPYLGREMPILHELLTYLWQLYQVYHNPALIFAGTGFEEQLRSTLGHFNQKLHSVRVAAFAEWEEIAMSLHQPTSTFFRLRYARAALDQIQRETSGQPYLLQSIGHLLVQAFNQVVQSGQHHNPIFTDKDVAATCCSSEFKNLALIYYQRVLDLTRSFHHSAPTLLRLIAHHGAYPFIHQVAPTIGITAAQLDQFLRSLDALGIIKLTISATGEPLMATIAVPSLGEYLRQNNNI